MGLTKQYLRFAPGPVFGVVGSSAAKVFFVDYESHKRYLVAVPACENVIIWNYRTSEIVQTLRGKNHQVTAMISDPVKRNLAVGYSDGTLKLFSLKTGTCTVTFSGHKTSVSCLAYDSDGVRIASGGKDTEIVLWDVVGESGLFRLRGHKGPVTKCCFLQNRNVMITSSEDTLLKFWDLDSQHCFQTLVGNRGEVWDFLLLNDSRLIVGVNDSNLRVWDLKFRDEAEVATETLSKWLPFEDLNSDLAVDELDVIQLKEAGKILTQGEKKTLSIGVDQNEKLLGCHGHTKLLQLFKLLTPEEATKKMRKRKRKERKQLLANGEDHISVDDGSSITLSDEITRIKPIQADAKVISFHMVTYHSGMARIAILLSNNTFAIYTLDLNVKDAESTLFCCVKSPGHRSDIMTLSFSSDSQLLLSASMESLKIWNRESQLCIQTMACGKALCSLFVTGDNYCIIGTKDGQLQLFDLQSLQLVEDIEAHSGAIAGMSASPDQKGIVSGSSDKDVKFWNYELIKDPNYSDTKKRLTLLHTRTLRMTEEILCLKFSPDHKFLAVSLLDCTVKVFYCDTLKFAFSLYGHKLPIPCMDISYDSSFLITGSKDRNIKIWSMEFGNCLKSLFAHEESLVCLQFLPKTHIFFSGGKDKKLKQWDADNFQRILTLEGHQSRLSAMTISPDGLSVVTTSHDKSLRLWDKTDEPLVLEEEQEMEREIEVDKQLTNQEPVIVGETNKEVGFAAKTTIETLKTVEQLIEALDIHQEETEKLEEYKFQSLTTKNLPLPAVHPVMKAYSITCPNRYVLKVLQKSKSSHLEETLFHLPFSYVIQFLKVLTEFSMRKWELELSTRCILFLLRIHLRQILGSKDTVTLIDRLQDHLLVEISELKDTVGFNLAGLKFMQKSIEQCEEVSLFADASQNLKRKTRKRRMLTFV